MTIYANGGSGRDLEYVTSTGMRYAHRHSCERVRKIRIRTL
jgi:hypothetical protein